MFEDTVKKAQEIMKNRGLGAIFLHPGVNTYYFTGLMKASFERLLTVIIPDEGEPVAVVPGFEVESLMKYSKIKYRDVRGWSEDQDPYILVGRVVEELGKSKSTIGIDGKMEYIFFEGIQRALPCARFIGAADVLNELRLIKSRDEVELMRKAARIICKAIKAAFESVSSGRTEIEVSEVLHGEIRRHGGLSRGYGNVFFGPTSALPHPQSSEKKIESGEIVLIDVGAQYQWYFSDVTRAAVLGQPTEKQKRLYGIVLNAQKTACEAVRPGIEAQELDRTARRIIREAGFGQNFRHRLGHGLGLEVHEGPYIVEGNRLRLRPGMTHSVEPGIYLLGEFGIRIEDDVAVTEKGCDNLVVDEFPKDELVII